MPRTKADGPSPSWDALYEAAAPPARLLPAGRRRGGRLLRPAPHYHCGSRVERIGRGLYRLRHFPYAPGDEYVPIWLWSKKVGVFSHETALRLHDLSDALPARYHLSVPTSWRRRRLRAPAQVVLHYGDLGLADVAWHGPVPVTGPLRTLIDCVASDVMPDLVTAATAQAIARRLVDPKALVQATEQVGGP